MKREEAIKILKQYQGYEPMSQDGETLKHSFDLTDETVDTLLTALRPVSREQVEKVWRGEWMGSADGYADGELVYDTWECSHCGYVIDEEDDPDMLPQFCPKCYAAMTDEAVEMVMERLEALKDGKGD